MIDIIVDCLIITSFIWVGCLAGYIICYFSRKKDDNLSKCHQCGKSVSFERHAKELPEEYEVCERCEDHVCNECVAWDYFRKVQEEIICNKCATLDILNSYEDEECPDCGEDIPKDVVDMQGCKNCDHVFTYYQPDDPEGEN
jgi:hypothetical protein